MVLSQAIGAAFGNAVLLQAIGAAFGNAVLLQTIGATFGDAILLQTVRTAFGNHGLVLGSADGWYLGSGKHVSGEDGEGEAENDLAFHECVLRGVVGGYGADVTRHDF